MPIGTLALALVLSSSAQDVSVLHNLPAGLSNVETLVGGVGGSTLAPAALQGIVLMPLDAVGRSTVTLLDPMAPRLRSDVPGGTRVLLPNEQGSLYRYRRDEFQTSTFGHFVVTPDGHVTLLGELPGAGASGTTDPFLRRVGTSRDGLSILIGTTREAGGQVFEARISGAGGDLRSPGGAPLELLRGGLALLPDWGVILTPDGPWRFERTPGATATPVPPAPGLGSNAFAYVGPDLVWSADGSRVAFEAGPSADAAYVWTLDRQGLAQRVSSVPRELSGAGHLPETPVGPTLALAPDGSAVAWRARVNGDNETFLRSLAPAAPGVETHLTASPRFNDTLNDTGVIAFFSPTDLVSLVGETDGNGIEGADFYLTELDPAGVITGISNLSRTSGDITVPFDEYGELVTEGGLLCIPGGAGFLTLQDDSGSDCLLLVSGRPGAPPILLLDEVEALELGSLSGGELVLAIRRKLAGEPLELHRWRPSEPDSLKFLAQMGSMKTVASHSGVLEGRFAAVGEAPGGRKLGRLDVFTNEAELLAPLTTVLEGGLEILPDGTLAGTVQLGIETRVFLWKPDDRLQFFPPRDGRQRILPSR